MSSIRPATSMGTVFADDYGEIVYDNDGMIESEFSRHIIIEPRIGLPQETFRLSDIPEVLRVQNTTLVLGGVIDFVHGNHFVCYCRRRDNAWELFADLAKGVRIVSVSNYHEDSIDDDYDDSHSVEDDYSLDVPTHFTEFPSTSDVEKAEYVDLWKCKFISRWKPRIFRLAELDKDFNHGKSPNHIKKLHSWRELTLRLRSLNRTLEPSSETFTLYCPIFRDSRISLSSNKRDSFLTIHCQIRFVMAEHVRRVTSEETHVQYLSKHIQNEFISLLSTKIQDQILNELKQATYYSIILASTPEPH
ncbi:hypothetical protein PR048_001944 [Dryococelus australis]|uniref:Uncharacterized protein n=1 Tax=Dryococelus australis TaxID=614101 RepID=A0ABQ9IIR6_9NEOP|nr:hypothetical protein PR048_001944 [Dryococelus australis]